jgi:hypothetical protein
MALPPGRRGSAPAVPADPVGNKPASAVPHEITPQRVLQELALIAFADLGRIAEWGPGWFRMKDSETLAKEDSAAIAELAPAAGGNGGYRVRLFDKRAALALLARHMQMYEAASRQQTEQKTRETAEDPRELIVRRLADLAAGAGTGRSDLETPDGSGVLFSESLGDLGTA